MGTVDHLCDGNFVNVLSYPKCMVYVEVLRTYEKIKFEKLDDDTQKRTRKSSNFFFLRKAGQMLKP